MAASGKMKDVRERAKKGTTEEKARLEQAAQKAKAFAEEHGEEARERISRAREQVSGTKRK